MIEKEETKKLEYRVNLLTLSNDGSFQCPKCGTIISPEDETNENYEIIDTKVFNGELAELVVACHNCESTLKLSSFLQIKY